MLIRLPTEVIEACTDFAEQCINTTRYQFRGQRNVNKIKQDILTGKLGEFAAYAVLKEFYPNLQLPDCQIYLGRKKSHSADLTDGETNFAIKTQSKRSMELYGNSFIMETTAIEKHKDMMFVYVIELEPDLFLVQNILSYEQVLACRGEPKLSYLKTKSAFYYQKHLANILQQNVQIKK